MSCVLNYVRTSCWYVLVVVVAAAAAAAAVHDLRNKKYLMRVTIRMIILFTKNMYVS